MSKDTGLPTPRPVPTEGERERLQRVIEIDRTVVARGIHGIEEALHAFQWLTEGRGSYEWDDDRWYEEFSNACEKIRERLEPLRMVALNLTDSPKDVSGRNAAVEAFLRAPTTEPREPSWHWHWCANGSVWRHCMPGLCSRCMDSTAPWAISESEPEWTPVCGTTEPSPEPPDSDSAEDWIAWLSDQSAGGYVDVLLPGARVTDLVGALEDPAAVHLGESWGSAIKDALEDGDTDTALIAVGHMLKELDALPAPAAPHAESREAKPGPTVADVEEVYARARPVDESWESHLRAVLTLLKGDIMPDEVADEVEFHVYRALAWCGDEAAHEWLKGKLECTDCPNAVDESALRDAFEEGWRHAVWAGPSYDPDGGDMNVHMTLWLASRTSPKSDEGYDVCPGCDGSTIVHKLIMAPHKCCIGVVKRTGNQHVSTEYGECSCGNRFVRHIRWGMRNRSDWQRTP